MQSFFELAVVFLVMMTVINGMFFVFGGALAGNEFDYASQADLLVTQKNVSDTVPTVESMTVKEGDPFTAIVNFVSFIVGIALGTLGALASFVGPFLAFGNAWSVILKSIFGSTGLLWDFLNLTLVNFINLLQLGSIVYILLYAISAVRGGSV